MSPRGKDREYADIDVAYGASLSGFIGAIAGLAIAGLFQPKLDISGQLQPKPDEWTLLAILGVCCVLAAIACEACGACEALRLGKSTRWPAVRMLIAFAVVAGVAGYFLTEKACIPCATVVLAFFCAVVPFLILYARKMLRGVNQ